MKKLLSIIVTLCMLACAAGFWLVGGDRFLKMQAGAETLGAEETFSQAEEKYIAYEAAYPVASRVEAYYSGDPDRVRSTGYVVYDAERKAFLYVVVTDRDGRGLEDLMWNLNLAAELRAGKDMAPSVIEGTLEPMDDSLAEDMLDALEESAVVGLYTDCLEDAVYMETYAGDEYGKTMAQMCENLNAGLQKAGWYQIKDGEVDGLQKSDVNICILAAGMSLLIFIIRILALFVGNRNKDIALPVPSGSRMEQFYIRQREWVEEWCEESLKRGRRYAYLSVVGGAVILVAIGIFVKSPTERLIAFYLPLGVLLGEIAGAMFWYGQRGQSKPEKILKKFCKRFGKLLPSAEEQEMFAEDMLNAGAEWNFGEKTKNSMTRGVLGSRYWVALLWNGAVTLIDAEKLGKIETETISGTVRSGKVRVHYESYAVRFYYKSAKPKKLCDESLSFDCRDNQRHFITLAKKRTGGNVEYMML